jgi:hypothetical protein
MLRDNAYLFDILESTNAALKYMRGKTWLEKIVASMELEKPDENKEQGKTP